MLHESLGNLNRFLCLSNYPLLSEFRRTFNFTHPMKSLREEKYLIFNQLKTEKPLRKPFPDLSFGVAHNVEAEEIFSCLLATLKYIVN